jgi:hypothetical protein
LFGFAKIERSTITTREQTALSVDAAALVVSTDEQILALIARAAIIELECNDE